MKQRIILTYPPDFDGQLHIDTETQKQPYGQHMKVEFTIAMQKGETEKMALRRVASDILEKVKV